MIRAVLRLRKFVPLGQRFDVHQLVAAALLASLDNIALEFIHLRIARVHDASLRLQRRIICDADFGQLFDQKLAAIPLGQWNSHFQSKRTFPHRVGRGVDCQRNLFFGNTLDSSAIFSAVAIEEDYSVAGTLARDGGQMVRLGPVQFDVPNRKGKTDIKSFGHFC